MTHGPLGALPLLEAGSSLRSVLASVLVDSEVERWLKMSPAEAVAGRRERDVSGTSVHVVLLRDGDPVGWAGWLRYRERGEWVESTTFLARRAWGQGVNEAAKALIWQVAEEAGVDLVASVHSDNERSFRAMRRAWPDVDPELVEEVRKGRQGWRFTLDRPPAVPLVWPDHLVQRMAPAVRRVPLSGE